MIPDLLILVQTELTDRPGKFRFFFTVNIRCRLTSIGAGASTQNTACIPSTGLTDSG
jgi:hypothetical protein